jgi:NAD(P)-dependent dehydrogenase (short-subunit alcohol dehydrogenase family)
MGATVLVAGAAGGVGEGIVRALLRRLPEVQVVATSRDAMRLAHLRERLGAVDDSRLVMLVGNAGSPAHAPALAEQIAREVGPLDVAIASLGGWWDGGPLLDVDHATWRAVMTEMLETHVVFAQAFVPLLLQRPGGFYLGIGGGAALAPVAGSSLVSIAGAAQLMLTRTLAVELAARDLRVLELVANGPVRTYENAASAAPDWITADEIGDVVADLVAGLPPAWPALRERGSVLIMDPQREPFAP